MSEFKEIIRGQVPVLVEFYANWYTPCKETLILLEDLKKLYGEKLRFLKVDADNNVDATAKYKIIAVPSFLLFRSGQILWRTQGVLSKEEVINCIEEAMKMEENE